MAALTPGRRRSGGPGVSARSIFAASLSLLATLALPGARVPFGPVFAAAPPVAADLPPAADIPRAPDSPLAAALPWSEEGHAVVCEIAWRELDPDARREVEELLSIDAEYGSFPPSCAWADVVRRRGGYDVYTPAHYVNLPRGADRFDVERDCAETLCVVEAIDIFAGRLADPTLSPEVRLEALKFLGHFVGDVHQPLHVGYGDDLGGNEVHACTPARDSTNLHAVWDGFVLRARMQETGRDWKAFAAWLQSEIRPIERRLWNERDPAVWAEESFAIVESEVYQGAGVACFTRAYAAAHASTVERRIKQAGFRLGALLNRVLG